jgi:uncharacterized protein
MYKVSWNEFETLSIDLAKKIIKSNKKFDLIIGVSRGGLLLARLLSSMLNIPLAVISSKHIKGKFVIDENISSLYKIKGNILLVDDVFQECSKEIVSFLKKKYKLEIILQACIFYKQNKTNFVPDYCINKVKDMLTIVFPYQENSICENLKYVL